MSTGRHWDAAYERLGTEGVSWFQRAPTVSRRLVDPLGLAADAPVIDVGGGTSTLVDELLAGGARDLSVLDLSATALVLARARLGADADRIDWIRGDVRDWEPARTYALWHDRAVFHFMVGPGDREGYLRAARRAIAPGGHAVLGTFAPDGPTRCSGLPVERYAPEELAAAFGQAFRLTWSEREEHRTPGGSIQAFTWILLERVDA